ncbi:MAG TPA: hypothetical protein VGB83_07480 [Actinomycetota bacterium]
MLLAAAVSVLAIPAAGEAALPKRIASSFFSKKITIDDDTKWRLACNGPFSSNTQIHVLVVSVEPADGSDPFTFQFTSTFVNSTWTIVKVGPYTHEEHTGPSSTWEAGGGPSMSGRSQPAGTLRVAGASWGNTLRTCVVTLDGVKKELKKRPRSNARYWLPTDGEGAASSSNVESTWAIRFEADFDGFLVAAHGGSAEQGVAIAVPPEGDPVVGRPFFLVARPTSGTWRFTSAGSGPALFGFDLMTALVLPR